MEKKILLVGLMLLLLVGTASVAEAARNFQCSVQNEVASGGNFSFDVFMRRLGDPIDLGDCQYTFKFTIAAFTSPTVSAVGNPALTGYVMSASLSGSDRVRVDVVKPGSGPFYLPTTDTKVATVTITGITNPSATAGLQWIGNNWTWVHMFDDVDITFLGDFVPPDDAPLPVTLAAFTARLNSAGDGVHIAWTTVSEVNNYGFYVQRKVEGEVDFADLAGSFVAGSGTTLELREYSYTDVTAATATRLYRLRQVDLDGTVHYTEPIHVSAVTSVDDARIPATFALEQNYPNPFNPTTTIDFALPQSSFTELKVFDMLGREVATLVSAEKPAGTQSIQWDAAGLSSGSYFYRITAGDFVQMRKMVLMR